MTREEFLSRYRNELRGIVLDAVLHGASRKGAELSLWLTAVNGRIEHIMAEIHAGLTQDNKQPRKTP